MGKLYNIAETSLRTLAEDGEIAKEKLKTIESVCVAFDDLMAHHEFSGFSTIINGDGGFVVSVMFDRLDNARESLSSAIFKMPNVSFSSVDGRLCISSVIEKVVRI